LEADQGPPTLAGLAPPGDVRFIAHRLRDAGFEAWAVGGAVRDAIAGGDAGDWDLTTSARPADVRRLFRRTVPIGIEHGTVGVLGRDGRMYEVTTFRRDVETFGRRARVAFADTLEEDLQRRDFTINAVAWNPLTGELRDPHGGVEDFRAGVLRTVGEPAERFAEDRLRVLRALRFAGKFDLWVEPATWEAIVESAGELGGLSAERIREELMKVLGLPRPSQSLRLYGDSGVLAALYPELAACVGVDGGAGEDVWTHQLHVVDALPRYRRTLRLAALLHDVGKPVAPAQHSAAGAAIARELLRRLKASNAESDRVVHLVAQHADLPAPDAPAPALRRWARLVGPAFLPDLFRLRFADCRARGDRCDPEPLLALRRRVRGLLRDAPPLTIGDLAINGADLRALGIPPGPLYGEILRDLLEHVTDDPSRNTRDCLISEVRARMS
jgi:tRNA nucleotidyltransferase/poly(A) polymerase